MAELVDKSSTEPTPSWNTEFSSLESLETDKSSSGGSGENLVENVLLSDVDSDWEEDDIKLLRLLKDPNFDVGLLLGKTKSRYPRDGVYLAKVRQILKDVTDWKKIHDLLMEDFRSDSSREKKKYREDLIKLRGKLSSLKRVHKRTSQNLAEREDSYHQVCEERDALQQRLSEYEEKMEQMSEKLEKTQHSIHSQDQEKQNLKNQVIALEGQRAKLEHCKVEAEKLKIENRSLTDRNVVLQGECQHLVNQLYQMSEEDRERLSILDQVISANKEQISVLRSERDDLERKNLEHTLTSTSVHANSASLLLSPDSGQVDRRRRSLIKDNWTQHTD